MELIDHKAMAITEKYLDKPLPFPNAPVSMMVRVDGFDGDVVSSEYERIGEIMLESGADDVLVAEEESERERLWEARSSVHDALAHVAGIVSNEDVVVPRSAISALLAGLRSICGRLDKGVTDNCRKCSFRLSHGFFTLCPGRYPYSLTSTISHARSG